MAAETNWKHKVTPDWGDLIMSDRVFHTDTIIMLAHWPLRDVEVILQVYFSNLFYKLISRALPVKFALSDCHWYSLILNIGSHNGLVPSSNKPLHEPVLTQIYVTIWCHWCHKATLIKPTHRDLLLRMDHIFCFSKRIISIKTVPPIKTLKWDNKV